MSKTPHKHLIARHLDRAALTGGLPPALADACTDLVAAIDAGKPGIPAKVQVLIADAWASTARQAAGAERPADQRKALAALRAVGQLESQLGRAPDTEADTEPVEDAVSDAADEPVDEAETEASYSTYGSSFGAAS